jgi:hypothetical protein
LIDFDDKSLLRPHLSNSFWVGDRISPACDRKLINEPESNQGYRDTYFGNAWSWTPAPGTAIYGKTEDLPSTPIDKLSSGEFLRVPYRRIPVIDIHSTDELLEFANCVVSKTSGVRGVWRGQYQQYELQRSAEERTRLYGDTSAVEPSLLPSASRSNGYFPDWFETWSALLDLFLDQHVQDLSAQNFSHRGEFANSTERFRCSYAYRQWGFATAQHYGIPSVGLDVTHEISVALFFALHQFSTDPATGAMSMRRATDNDNPVIYGLGGMEEHDLLDDEKLSPPWLQCSRPKAQMARFFATGWGEAANKAADRIYAALRLVGHTAWRSPYDAREIFPSSREDVFLDFLMKSRSRYSNSQIEELLRRVYFVP